MKTLVKTNRSTNLNDSVFGTNWMEDFFSENLPQHHHFEPKADILEKEKEFMISLALPGLSKKDVKIDLMDNKLSISGETLKDEKLENEKFISREIVKGTFHRDFRLGNHIDVENIEASFKDGMLIIHLPKSEKANPKTINIK